MSGRIIRTRYSEKRNSALRQSVHDRRSRCAARSSDDIVKRSCATIFRHGDTRSHRFDERRPDRRSASFENLLFYPPRRDKRHLSVERCARTARRAANKMQFNCHERMIFDDRVSVCFSSSMYGDVNISAILDSFSGSYDKRVRPNYGGESTTMFLR